MLRNKKKFQVFYMKKKKAPYLDLCYRNQQKLILALDCSLVRVFTVVNRHSSSLDLVCASKKGEIKYRKKKYRIKCLQF